MMGISFLLIIKQPDLGTALIFLMSGICLAWLAGMPRWFFVSSMCILLICAPALWHFMHTYQKKRILVYMGYGDLNKERYQLEQAYIAIGSGGMQGKGFLQGTQNKLQFLPESRTDFAFCVLAEEFGLLGSLFIILLYALLCIRALFIITSIHAPYMQLLAVGFILPFILSALINICMVTGLVPVVGIPLPLISYGLSNLWITYAGLGWFNSIAIRRFYWGD
jgi:rod shape determining protein RodA